MDKMSRRSFLKAGTAATAALAMTPSEVLAAQASKKKAKTPTKLKLLGVGVGGRGGHRCDFEIHSPQVDRFAGSGSESAADGPCPVAVVSGDVNSEIAYLSRCNHKDECLACAE